MDPANELACGVYVSQFQCPSSLIPQHASQGEGQGIPNRVPCNYLGCASGLNNRESGAYPFYDDEQTADGLLYCNSKIRLRDITDGQSTTVMIGEAIFGLHQLGRRLFEQSGSRRPLVFGFRSNYTDQSRGIDRSI